MTFDSLFVDLHQIHQALANEEAGNYQLQAQLSLN